MNQIINPKFNKTPFPIIGKSIQDRATECNKEIQRILEAYNCVLVPHFEFFGSQISANVIVHANERKLQA